MLWIALAPLVFGVLALAMTGYPPRPVGLRAFSAREAEVVRACADAMFPEGGLVPESGSQAGIVSYLDWHLLMAPLDKRLLMRLMFAFIELSPVVFGPRHRRFTKLRAEEQKRVLAEAFTSQLYFRRMVFFSLRTLLCFGYFSNPSVLAHMGCAPNPEPFKT